MRTKMDALSWKRAAVLVPLIDHDSGLTMLFTRRVGTLNKHAGEISFPGGKADPDDDSDVDTALREGWEEISLKRPSVTLLGELPFFYTSTGYEVRPVVGIVVKGTILKANPTEVAEIFEVPLAYLMDPANHVLKTKIVDGRTYSVYAISYQNHYIWGATAGMIRSFYERLYA